MTLQPLGELKPLEVPTDDNGTEVLWVDAGRGVVQVLSVPVFAYGVSRESVVATEPHGDRLRFVKVLQSSPGATLRCYVAQEAKASDMYNQRVFPDAKRMGLRIGPATFLDPEIVAFHVATRAQMGAVTKYLDDLARQGLIRFWEFGDPPAGGDGAHEKDETSTAQWELVHQLPIEGQPNYVAMH
jgi:hypothetical protein